MCQRYCGAFYGRIVLMKGMTITFRKRSAAGKDELNNPTYTYADVVVDDCLVAPPTEPVSVREQQAMEQSRDVVRVHLPKASDADISHSTFVYGGKKFTVDSDNVQFMNENTPTRWNRYFRAESVNT